eukprot:11996468-Alexandrium_andersonii.AAC.1
MGTIAGASRGIPTHAQALRRAHAREQPQPHAQMQAGTCRRAYVLRRRHTPRSGQADRRARRQSDRQSDRRH